MRDGGVDHEISALLNSLASVGDSMEHSSDTNIALVVDDENMNVFSMREQLKILSISSDTTMISTKALLFFQHRVEKAVRGTAEMYKLLLIDYSMPDMDGLELMKELRALIDANQQLS